ncbi:type I restriction endonuclease subunit R [Leeuwenhoekiella parthenopeia]|uniref:Type I restriction enzyme endonuclease subunit n=1 Tax=Leeuwenhoekiella parthenopeia TaxID=2890320 RepID=A0ABS8GNA0_9FLAO|nr:type I restriction endonuclease subunit R [Leeuwenhoekiella parthenopeia]MCC4211389.1 type I restriction endonuclease subunit R [Leeuwenhoekiella parthenopeia]
MSNDYSEDSLIEKTTMRLFADLEWETANVFYNESFGANGTIGRDSQDQVILKHLFLKAIQELNPDLPSAAYIQAYEQISKAELSKTLIDINKDKYELLKRGIPVTYKNDKGELIREKKLKVFNFDNPTSNHFLAVQQLWVAGVSGRKRRADVVGFVNGIPLVFIELKAHHIPIRQAYEKNISDYKDVIPKLWHTNAFIVLSNGIESKVGSLTSKFVHYHEWKRIREEEEGIISLETVIKGTCDKSNLLDIFENYILYDDSLDKTAKLVARNHQFLGVNKAYNHFQDLKSKFKAGLISREESQRLGVFWHTQGSGKSYSMVFWTQKILQTLSSTYTFVLLTDRTELDDQIYGTYDGVGVVKNKKAKARSAAHLKQLLQTDNKYIFSLIHKFNFEEELSLRDDIIVISDEAHRTQGGSLAMNMRKALPNASFIGFTGTPLFKDDELTKRIFGDYVSKYDFKRSIEDGATVPLYYENRGEKLRLENPQIDENIKNKIAEFDLDDNQEEKLKQLFAREYPILTANKRLKAIAKDVVEHFNTRGYRGKALFIAIDKVTAVKMYDFISEAWDNYVEELEQEASKLKDEQEQLMAYRNLKWVKETEISVIVSSEQNEIKKFRDWGLDIEPHREKMNTRDLESEFKDENNPFRLAIVCAMWITGFDVKSLSTLYIDKPLKSHTLMQAIARANRVHTGKNNGLIVDYIETYKALLKALAIYGGGGSGKPDTNDPPIDEPPVKPLEDLIEDLRETIDAMESFLKHDCDFDLKLIAEADDTIYRIKYLQEGYNAVCETQDTRNKFNVLAREVFKKYKALMPNKAIYEFKSQRDAINGLYNLIQDKVEDSDITYLVKQVQDEVNESIETYNTELDKVDDYGKQVDISKLDFDRIKEEFNQLKSNKSIAVKTLQERVKKKLDALVKKNPLRVNYYERYEQIIEDYNLGKEYKSIKEVFDELIKLFGDLNEEEKRSGAESLTEDELAVFDMLNKGKTITDKEKAEVKEAARNLLKKLQENEFKVVNWSEKSQTKAAVRKAINDYLYSKLPYPTYEDGDIAVKTELLYNFFELQYHSYSA